MPFGTSSNRGSIRQLGSSWQHMELKLYIVSRFRAHERSAMQSIRHVLNSGRGCAKPVGTDSERHLAGTAIWSCL